MNNVTDITDMPREELEAKLIQAARLLSEGLDHVQALLEQRTWLVGTVKLLAEALGTEIPALKQAADEIVAAAKRFEGP